MYNFQYGEDGLLKEKNMSIFYMFGKNAFWFNTANTAEVSVETYIRRF